jgi:hypothetical protein
LRVAILARKFAFRQGLWIEDLRIPPGQECSNGSLILLAVVLWRTLLTPATGSRSEGNRREAQRWFMSYETP